MSLQQSTTFLRRVLAADAVTSLASGTLQVAAADALAGVLGLPRPLLLEVGLFYLAYGALVAWTALRTQPPRSLVLLFAVGNLAWAAACIAALAGPWLHPTGLGIAFVAVQAVAVAAFGELQWWSLRRPRASAMA